MIGLIFKISLAALLTTSCAINERVVQDQIYSNVNANQTVNTENSSNTDVAEKKTVDYFGHLRPEHREILRDWLKSKTFLRPAREETDNSIFLERYKSFFEENYKILRETVGENAYQYYAVGDMNHDRETDFAVLLVDNRKRKEAGDFFVMAIFNAPFVKGQKPVYYEENLHGISNSYIAFGALDEPYLYLGKFESDVYCATYYPKGKTYYFKDCLDE